MDTITSALELLNERLTQAEDKIDTLLIHQQKL